MSRSSFGQPPQPSLGMQNPKGGIPQSAPKMAPRQAPAALPRPVMQAPPPSMFRRPGRY